MLFVSAFTRQAAEIFEAASAATEDCDLSILVNREGGIHMIANSEWPLESLRAHHGASAAYSVRRSGGSVRLEAREQNRRCVLASERPQRALLPALADFPQYLTYR